jgi:hypothetical protein
VAVREEDEEELVLKRGVMKYRVLDLLFGLLIWAWV